MKKTLALLAFSVALASVSNAAITLGGTTFLKARLSIII
jgi:hypothetical protein